MFKPSHIDTYPCRQPAQLGPHRPRSQCDGRLPLTRHECPIQPPPAGRSGRRKGRGYGARPSIHRWPEGFVPSTGRHGFGPAAEEHVAVAAAAHSIYAAPKEGSHFGNARSTLQAEVPVHVDA